MPGNLAFNLDLNLLVAHTAMGEHELAQAVYDRIKLQKITPGNHLKLGVAASEHLFLINDYDAYVKDHRWLSTCFESAQEVEGEYVWLYPPHRERLTGDSVHAPASRREWDILRWSLVTRQRLLEALPANEIPADFADSEEIKEIKEVDHRIWLALLLFPFGMLAGWWGRKSPRKRPHSHNNIHPLIQELKLHVEQGAQSSVILEQLNKLDGIWRAKHHEIHRQIKLTDAGLTRVEDQVLELIASGRTSKEIAHVLDLSVSYVYNVRTRLRKKLNVPDELQLEQWIHESTS